MHSRTLILTRVVSMLLIVQQSKYPQPNTISNTNPRKIDIDPSIQCVRAQMDEEITDFRQISKAHSSYRMTALDPSYTRKKEPIFDRHKKLSQSQISPVELVKL